LAECRDEISNSLQFSEKVTDAELERFGLEFVECHDPFASSAGNDRGEPRFTQVMDDAKNETFEPSAIPMRRPNKTITTVLIALTGRK
jgi:hypothetical protein